MTVSSLTFSGLASWLTLSTTHQEQFNLGVTFIVKLLLCYRVMIYINELSFVPAPIDKERLAPQDGWDNVRMYSIN